jgi:hypothetical protein
MGEVVNLRRARKAKGRAAAATQASANRHAFGRTKAQKDADAAAQGLLDRTLDGARRDD